MNDVDKNFYQSALLISAVVSLSLAVSFCNPIPEVIGMKYAPFSFAKWLGIYWLSYAIFKDRCIKHWQRMVLYAIALGLFICSLYYSHCPFKIIMFRIQRPILICLLVASIGYRPVIGKTFRENLAVCVLLFVLWLFANFLTGWQAQILSLSDRAVIILRAVSGVSLCALSLSVISLSLRDEFRPFYNLKGTKALLTCVCVLCFAYVAVRDIGNIHLIDHLVLLPLCWYMLFVTVRLLWKAASVFGINCPLSWRDVLFDSRKTTGVN